MPTPSTLPEMIKNVAIHEFCTRPAAAIALMNRELSPLSTFRESYRALTATPSKVLSLLSAPDVSNPAEERIFGYLTTMIGNISSSELRNFLRFVTGTSVCIAKKKQNQCSV